MANNKLEIGTTVDKLPFEANTSNEKIPVGTTVKDLPFKVSEDKSFEENISDIPYTQNKKTSFWGEVGRQLYSEPDPKNPTLMMKLLHPVAESDLIKPIINSRIVQETVKPIAEGLNKGLSDIGTGIAEIKQSPVHGTLKTLTGAGETLFNAIPAAQAFSVAANALKSSRNPYVSKAVDIPFTAISSLAKVVGYKPEEDSNGQLILGLMDLGALGAGMKYMEVKGKSADKNIANIQSQQDLTKVTQKAANGQLDPNQQKELGNYFEVMQNISSADLIKAAIKKGTPESDAIGEKIINAHKDVSNALSEQEKNDMLYDFVSRNDVPSFKLKLQKLYQDGNISEDDFNDSNHRLENYEKFWNSVKDRGFSDEKNKSIFDLAWKSENLRNNIDKAKSDPNLENDPIAKAQLANDEKSYDSHIEELSKVIKKEAPVKEEKNITEKDISEAIVPKEEVKSEDPKTDQKENSAFAKTGIIEMKNKLGLSEDVSFEDVRKEYSKRKDEFEIKNGKLELRPKEESVIEKKSKQGEEIKESEASKLISQESFSPKEITDAYIRERENIKESKLSHKDQIISENLNKIKQEGFERFGDKNNITKDIKDKYFDLKNGRAIDDEALHLSEIGGIEITPEDIVNHIMDFDNKKNTFKENKITTALRKRYQEVTGKELHSRDIEKLLPKKEVELEDKLPFSKTEISSGENHTLEERKAQIGQLQKAMPRVKVISSDLGKGKAGRIKDGVVELNPNYNQSETPIHEFGHALIDMMGGIEHPLIQKGVNQLRGTNLWYKIETAYPELSKDMLEKEVLATAIGKKGVGVHADKIKSTMLKHWIDNFINKVRRVTGITNDVARTLAKQLLSGKEIKLKDSEKLQPSEIQESKVLPKKEKNEYDKNYEMSKDRVGKFKVDAKRVWEQVKNTSSRMLEPIHSVLKDISPELAKMIRDTGIDIRKSIDRDGKLVRPLMDKVSEMRKMSKKDYSDFNLALNSKDLVKLNEISAKYKMANALESVRKMYDDSFARQKAVGFDVSFTKDYFHRSVKDVDGFFKYLENKMGDKYNVILDAISAREKELGKELTKEERANFVSNILRGYNSDKVALGKIGSMNERTIQNVDAEMNQYYHDAIYSTMKYIADTNEAIEARKFFGKGSTDIGMANQKEGISFKLLDALQKDNLTGEELNKITTVLDARFNRKSPHRLFSSVKNLAYIDALGGPIPGLTQLKDIAFSIDKSGLIKTGKSIGKIIIGKHEIDVEKDLNFSDELAEFSEGGSRTHSILKKVLRPVFTRMDKFGKNIYINSLLDKYINSAKNFNKLGDAEQKSFVKKINESFLDENRAKKVIGDLKRGEATEDVKFLMANELLNLQPSDYSEYPVGYLKGGNARVLYALKTFQLKQLDYFRRETTKKIFNPNSTKAEKVEGMKSFVRLGMAMVVMGAGIDELKDFILRKKPTKLSDRFVENALQIGLMNRYDVNQTGRQGIAKTLENKVLPPSIKSIDNASMDISDAIKGKKSKNRFVKNLPVIGTTGQIIYRWWNGQKNN